VQQKEIDICYTKNVLNYNFRWALEHAIYVGYKYPLLVAFKKK